MENLVKTSQELEKKQSHVRDSFREFLDEFKKATEVEVHNDKLEFIPLGGFDEGEAGTNQLFFQRGLSKLYFLPAGQMMYQPHLSLSEHVKNGIEQEVDLYTCDMRYIRVALSHLPDALQQHVADMKEAGKENEQLSSMLNKLID